MLDADLQDPREEIPKMVAEWERGADVVYMVRAEREGETAFKLATARWFYRSSAASRRSISSRTPATSACWTAAR